MTSLPLPVRSEVRCVGDHPRFPRLRCGAKLAEVVGPPVAVTPGKAPVTKDGVFVIRCARCGTQNVITPAPAA